LNERQGKKLDKKNFILKYETAKEKSRAIILARFYDFLQNRKK